MKQLLTMMIAAVGLVWLVGASQVNDRPAAEATVQAEDHFVAVQDREFVGVAKCRTCHRKEESGEQFQKWEASAHAKAYQTLASDEAKKIAAERGIDDPQASGECLQCHVTAFGVKAELLGEKYAVEDGVGCESCHGPGGDYYKKKTMEGITSGEIKGASVGLVKPGEAVCVECHNEKSPNFKGFNFDEYAKKIAHPIPEATKASYAGS